MLRNVVTRALSRLANSQFDHTLGARQQVNMSTYPHGTLFIYRNIHLAGAPGETALMNNEGLSSALAAVADQIGRCCTRCATCRNVFYQAGIIPAATFATFYIQHIYECRANTVQTRLQILRCDPRTAQLATFDRQDQIGKPGTDNHGRVISIKVSQS